MPKQIGKAALQGSATDDVAQGSMQLVYANTVRVLGDLGSGSFGQIFR
jgi:hypothetical protein